MSRNGGIFVYGHQTKTGTVNPGTGNVLSGIFRMLADIGGLGYNNIRRKCAYGRKYLY